MKLIIAAFSLFTVISAAQVKSGIEVLAASDFSMLNGKRVGLVTNPTGITSAYESTVDVLARSSKVKLVALMEG